MDTEMRETQVTKELAGQKGVIQELSDNLKKLDTRLSRALRKNIPEENKAPKVMEELVPLALELHQNNVLLQDFSNRVNGWLQRLEL